MEFSVCPNDDNVGPGVKGCRDDFDFTIRFERIFLSLVPTAIFIAISLPRSAYLLRRPSIVEGGYLQATKLAAVTIYAALQLALLILSCLRAKKFEALFISSFSVTVFSAGCIAILSFLEHSRSPRPSILLNGYLFLSLLFDVAEIRTLWLVSTSPDEISLSRLLSAAVATKVVLIVLESQHKSQWMQWDATEHSPEETSGLFGLGTYAWINRLLFTGYKKVLAIDNLFPLDQSMAAESLHIKLAEHLKTSESRSKKHRLFRALAKTLAVPFLLPVGPRIMLTAFSFCQPFLINRLLDYLQESPGSSRNVGYGLIGATILIYVGMAGSNAFYWYFQERAVCMARSALAGIVYKKTTEVKFFAADDSAALTLMSNDVENSRRGLLGLHEFWANTIEVGIAFWLLERQVGAAFVAPLVVILCCVASSSILSRYTGPRQKLWMEKIQKRVGITANAIGNMKHLKISGLTGPVEDVIQKLRVDELATGTRFRLILTFSAVIGFTPSLISPVATFAFTAKTLDITNMFTSMSYLILLSQPLSQLFQSIPSLIGALTCLDRINAFLEQDQRIDSRKMLIAQPNLKVVSDIQGSNDNARSPATMMKVSRGNFSWVEGKTSLQDIDVDIPASLLTIVVGPVASGKSTLCRVLLGELSLHQGQVTIAHGVSKIGYCSQTPYLWNATIRENIVGFASFNLDRYSQVINATMLKPDLDALSQGDKTRVGSGGITLSGGQRQRVSMARALYLSTPLFMFDDVLSGLDADTEEQVFRRVFGREGLLKRWGATAVLCTHSVRHVPSADHIIALGPEGTVVEQGTFHQLVENRKYVYSLGIEVPGSMDEDRGAVLADDETITQPTPLEVPTKSPIPSRVTDNQSRMTGDITVYRHYLTSINTISIISLLIFGAGWGFFSNWGSIWLKYWSEDASSAHPVRSNPFYIGLYALFQVSALASLFGICLVGFGVMIRVSGAKFHKAALTTVMNAPLRFFTTTDTGVITNLFSQDLNLIDEQLPGAVVNVVLITLNTLGRAAVVATPSPYLIATYPAVVAILYGVQKFYLRTSRQIRLLDLEAKGPLYTHFLDTIKGIETFRAFGWIQSAIDLNIQLVNTSQRPAYLLTMIQRWLGLIMQLVTGLLAVAMVTLAIQLRSNTGFAGASLVALMSIGNNLAMIVVFYTGLETSIGAVSRLKSFSERVKSESQEEEKVVPDQRWPSRGEIQIKSVSASYGDVSNEVDPEPTSIEKAIEDKQSTSLVFKNLNISIAPGEKVAICGRSGSGKSSLILLLLRLLDPLPSCSGRIIIDGLPLHTIDRSTLRRRIIALPQEAVFLPDGMSFQTNLDPFGMSTEVECRAVLETVNIWAIIDDRGGLGASMAADTLSQGQKQLFSLARAILRCRIRSKENALASRGTKRGDKFKNSDANLSRGILLLDEVSSSVDQETDRFMQKIIHEEFSGYTIVMVSHRLEMVMGFDAVLVMDNGVVIESGRPETLAGQGGSQFKKLCMIARNS